MKLPVTLIPLLTVAACFPDVCAATPSYTETTVQVVDQHGTAIPGVSISASYGCETFNPVDSAGWDSDARYKKTSNSLGMVKLPGFKSPKFRLFSSCQKQIFAYKYGYANLLSGHSFSSYSSIDSCLREFFTRGEVDTSKSTFIHSSCRAQEKLDSGDNNIKIHLYKLKSCDDIKAGIKDSEDRQALARDIETLSYCASGYTPEERLVFYPLIKSLLLEAPKTYKQPVFEDEAIYRGALKVLGYLCDGNSERIAIFKKWIEWLKNASQSKDSGWGPLGISREAVESMALFNNEESIKAIAEYLDFEEKSFYERWPHIKQPLSSHHPWKMPRDFPKKLGKICGAKSKLPSTFFQMNWNN